MNFSFEIEIDVVKEILIYPDALAPRRGEKVRLFLERLMEKIKNPTLLHINLKEADPIDYLFSKVAFGQIFKLGSEKTIIDTIYYIDTTSQKDNLLNGFLHFINPAYTSSGSLEDDFVNADLSIKIADNKSLQFISRQEKEDLLLLDFVNEMGEISIDDVFSKFKKEIKPQKITETVERLKLKRFIYSNDEPIPEILYSIYKNLKNYE
jgi:hypothetical protein